MLTLTTNITLNSLEKLLNKVRKPANTAQEERAQEIADALRSLGECGIAWRYQDGVPVCVLAHYDWPLTWSGWDAIVEAVGTEKVDMGRRCVRVWV